MKLKLKLTSFSLRTITRVVNSSSLEISFSTLLSPLEPMKSTKKSNRSSPKEFIFAGRDSMRVIDTSNFQK